ncbi:MAG: hypothetical protein NC411_00050 [Bacteroides sp.]|nr:hypothetical protein [Bacteroides sp.]
MTRVFVRHILILFSLMCGGISSIHAAETAASILDKASAKFSEAKSLMANYTITADGNTQSGQLVVAGDRFTLSSPQMSSWYDGKTQWTYSTHTGEVNITEPTPEELQQVNPFAIINSFRKQYKASLMNSASTVKKIKLNAINQKNDIKSVVLTLNATSLYPTRIELALGNRRVIRIDVNSVTAGSTLPQSEFRFNPKKFPGIPVVDLR